jgi:hypothetical protein
MKVCSAGLPAGARETSIKTTNYGASLLIAAIYCFRVLTLPFVRSLVFSDFSGAMTLEMSLNENTSSASLREILRGDHFDFRNQNGKCKTLRR